jgi:phage-related protein
MILLHGFIKKSRKTPKQELDLAVKRRKELER